jgi:hypothetical protein
MVFNNSLTHQKHLEHHKASWNTVSRSTYIGWGIYLYLAPSPPLLLWSSSHAFSHLLALPIWKRLHIVVGFGHKIILAQTSLTLRVTSGHLCVHMMDGHGSITVHASGWEVLDPVSWKFEPVIKSSRVITPGTTELCLFTS